MDVAQFSTTPSCQIEQFIKLLERSVRVSQDSIYSVLPCLHGIEPATSYGQTLKAPHFEVPGEGYILNFLSNLEYVVLASIPLTIATILVTDIKCCLRDLMDLGY